MGATRARVAGRVGPGAGLGTTGLVRTAGYSPRMDGRTKRNKQATRRTMGREGAGKKDKKKPL